jgi:hypothetical protein
MSPALIAIFFGFGVGGWAYSKVAHSTGNSDPKSVAMVSVGAGLVAAIFIFTLFKYIFNW